mmetsp:Transcript_33863/g.85630  ORF Transcript_33863/g.85630 Transcript_33863/m.85630 type:complete len:460 (+) Transcript_33863:3-1382(+)
MGGGALRHAAVSLSVSVHDDTLMGLREAENGVRLVTLDMRREILSNKGQFGDEAVCCLFGCIVARLSDSDLRATAAWATLLFTLQKKSTDNEAEETSTHLGHNLHHRGHENSAVSAQGLGSVKRWMPSAGRRSSFLSTDTSSTERPTPNATPNTAHASGAGQRRRVSSLKFSSLAESESTTSSINQHVRTLTNVDTLTPPPAPSKRGASVGSRSLGGSSALHSAGSFTSPSAPPKRPASAPGIRLHTRTSTLLVHEQHAATGRHIRASSAQAGASSTVAWGHRRVPRARAEVTKKWAGKAGGSGVHGATAKAAVSQSLTHEPISTRDSVVRPGEQRHVTATAGWMVLAGMLESGQQQEELAGKSQVTGRVPRPRTAAVLLSSSKLAGPRRGTPSLIGGSAQQRSNETNRKRGGVAPIERFRPPHLRSNETNRDIARWGGWRPASERIEMQGGRFLGEVE